MVANKNVVGSVTAPFRHEHERSIDIRRTGSCLWS